MVVRSRQRMRAITWIPPPIPPPIDAVDGRGGLRANYQTQNTTQT
jgi:hypothetical protein